MKTPVVDYRKFRFSKLNDPEFSHLKLLSAWIFYFLAYFITENFIPAESCHVIHCRIDDLIPFCEWFVIAYVGWYFLVAGSLLYFALYNVDSFKKLMKFIIVTQIVATAIYIIYPSRQDLRPDTFQNNNILTRLVGLLYAADTSTNVCPSLHVGYSLALLSVWMKEKQAAWWWKGAVVVFVVLICLSTMFIKQHSAVDFFVALPMCALAEWIVYHRKPKVK